MNLTEIGGRIKARRKALGLSQEKLAELVFVSPHYIYEIERGSKVMSLETLTNLSSAMSLSTDFILFGGKSARPTLGEQLDMLDEEQRRRAEDAFTALLPYIK